MNAAKLFKYLTCTVATTSMASATVMLLAFFSHSNLLAKHCVRLPNRFFPVCKKHLLAKAQCDQDPNCKKQREKINSLAWVAQVAAEVTKYTSIAAVALTMIYFCLNPLRTNKNTI